MTDNTDTIVLGMEGHSDLLRVAANAGASPSTLAKAEIPRQRKVKTNPAQKTRNLRSTADSNVSAWDRLTQFKGEHLTLVSGNSDVMHARKPYQKRKALL